MKKLLIIIIVATAAFWYCVDLPDRDQNTVIVSKGMTSYELANRLAAEGVVRNAFVFRYYLRLTGTDRKLVVGSHNISTDKSIFALARSLTDQNNLSTENVITTIEGWRASEMRDYLVERGIVTDQDWQEAILTDQWRDQYAFLAGVNARTVEGFLFPDTYRIFVDAKAIDIVDKMLANFDRQLTVEMRQELAKNSKSIYEVVTLASIVERESLGDQQPMVADIFWKRLDIGMALQSDATVNYVTGKSSLRPTHADLEVDSPYNTYRYPGLPPTPISNPGLNALKAVVYPQRNPYYYFLTDLEGKIYYGRTYEEHQANIARYLE